jgi:hypothetical protein
VGNNGRIDDKGEEKVARFAGKAARLKGEVME